MTNYLPIKFPGGRHPPRSGSAGPGYRSDSDLLLERQMGMTRSRTYQHRPRHPQAVSQEEFEIVETTGYYSDASHGRRARSLQRVVEVGPRIHHPRPVSPTEGTDMSGKRVLPQVPSDLYGEEVRNVMKIFHQNCVWSPVCAKCKYFIGRTKSLAPI